MKVQVYKHVDGTADILLVPCKLKSYSRDEVSMTYNGVIDAVRHSQTVVICELDDADAFWGYNPLTLDGQVWDWNTNLYEVDDVSHLCVGSHVSCDIYESI